MYSAASSDENIFNDGFYYESKLAIAGNTLYAVAVEDDNLRISRLSADSNAFVPVQGVPSFETPDERLEETSFREEYLREGAFAVSDGTFYLEFRRVLFKWKPGNPKWRDTGLIDTGEQPREDTKPGFKLAVSGDTVYVGKREGQLFQSLDAGSSWKDITSALPLRFTHFNEIVFAGSTVYIATDTGVLASQTGEHWRVLTRKIVMDRLAVDGTAVYGAQIQGSIDWMVLTNGNG